MKQILLKTIGVATLAATLQTLPAAPTILDDFNVNSGHFTSALVGGSGSTTGIKTPSAASRITTNSPVEGAGQQKLNIIATTPGNNIRIRHLSGGGSAGNNTPIVTSDGVDGWIGLYIKTEDASVDPNWTVELWLESASLGNNGSIPKTIIADGQWHLYEWDLDNTTGDANGWGAIANLAAGTAVITNGAHTLDSIIFRNSTGPATNVLYIDFLARNDAGSVADLLLQPCLGTSGILVNGPLATNNTEVSVGGVSASATNLTIYQNTGPGGSMVAIGAKPSGITAGNNSVTVSGLVKGAIVAATQTINGQEGCVPTTGVFVGGGANPSVRAALSLRETSSTGPIGSPGDSTSPNIHFLGANAVSGGAPINADIIYPSNGWQTVTFFRGTNVSVGDAANATGTVVDGSGYGASETVTIQVYAARTLPNGSTVYATLPAEVTGVLTSNDVFSVNWTWDAVPNATGYRLIRNLNGLGFFDYQDVPGNSFSDVNTGWLPGDFVTPKTVQSGRSVQWFESVSNTNKLPGQWAILESIAFAIHNSDDTGPFDLYIDNLKNGNTIFQTFEAAPANTGDYGFRAPGFSTSTTGSILTTPQVGQVSNLAADTGEKSFRLRYQWNGTNSAKWLRLTTSGVNNPQVNLDEPISFRILLQPAGATLPAAPAAPTLTITPLGTDKVLNWTGGHRLQTAVNATGTYTNVPRGLGANNWTNITSGGYLGPWTNTYTEPTRFFRLAD